MLFEGQAIKLDTYDGGIAELRFERGVEAVNKHMRRAGRGQTEPPARRR
jgi:hypothetical protein